MEAVRDLWVFFVALTWILEVSFLLFSDGRADPEEWRPNADESNSQHGRWRRSFFVKYNRHEYNLPETNIKSP